VREAGAGTTGGVPEEGDGSGKPPVMVPGSMVGGHYTGIRGPASAVA
jgi:hypothetical protein